MMQHPPSRLAPVSPEWSPAQSQLSQTVTDSDSDAVAPADMLYQSVVL